MAGAVVTTVWSDALFVGTLVPLRVVAAVIAGRFAAGTSAFASSGA
jgi:hypothetical protein